jgi:ribosome maturation factor RimP
MSNVLLEKITEIVESVAVAAGLELVEVQFKGVGHSRLLRIYIDRQPGGTTLDDCESISKQVGERLDAEEVIPGDHYTLEVSTPGVERKLLRTRDYERNVGKKIKVILIEPIGGKTQWDGTLTGIAGGEATLELVPGQELRFHLEQVKRANLKFEW